MRLPQREDDQRDGEPTQGLDALVRLGRAGIVHDVEQTAKTGDAATDDGNAVFVGRNVDTNGISGSGVLAHGAEMEADLGFGQYPGCNQGDDNAQEYHDTAILPGGTGEQEREGGAEGRDGLQVHVSLESGHDVAHNAGAEYGHGQAGDVLVGLEGNGQDTIQKAHQTGGQEGGQDAQDNHKNAGDVPCQHKTVDHGTAACGAYAHDTGDTQIEVTDLLGQNLTRGAIEECHAQRNRVQQKIQDVFHA